jgi:methyl-CpG-binding domain protein 4
MPQAPDSGRLFQEDLCSEPFWMLVACILINRTHWRQVKPVLEQLRARCDGPGSMIEIPIEEMMSIVKPLGMYNRRTSMLRRFCAAWLLHKPRHSADVSHMPGCGDYAVQSYQIFIEKDVPKGLVTDHKLQWYIENYRGFLN